MSAVPGVRRAGPGVLRAALCIAAAVFFALLFWSRAGPFVSTRTVEAAFPTGWPGGAALEVQWGKERARNGAWLFAGAPEARVPARGTLAPITVTFTDAALAERWKREGTLTLREHFAGAEVRRKTLAPRSGENTATLTLLPPTEPGVSAPLLDAGLSALCAAVLGLLASLAFPAVVKLRARVPTPGLQDARPGAALRHAPIVLVAAVHTAWALLAPVMYCPDSLDYLANAELLRTTRSFVHFNAWRSPGYSVVLAPLLAVANDPGPVLALLQALACIAVAWLCGDMLRPLAPPLWRGAAVLVAGLDPILLLWQRHIMPETLSTLLAALLAWSLVRSLVRAASPAARPGGSIASGVAVGALIGVACYARGNFQLFIVLAPLVLAWGMARHGRRAAICCLAAALVLVAPLAVRNARTQGAPALTVGGAFARCLFAFEGGVLDVNQTAAFDAQSLARIRAGVADGSLGAYHIVHEVNTGRLAPLGADLPRMAATDTRARIVVAESLRRNPPLRWKRTLQAFLTQTGIWSFTIEGYRENAWWSRPLRGTNTTNASNHWITPEQNTQFDADLLRDLHRRTQRDISPWLASSGARVFGVWLDAAALARPLLALLAILGVAVSALAIVVRGNPITRAAACGVLVPGLIALAHAAAIAGLLLTGLDRYAAPFWPLWAPCAAYGAFVLVRALRTPNNPQTPAELP